MAALVDGPIIKYFVVVVVLPLLRLQLIGSLLKVRLARLPGPHFMINSCPCHGYYCTNRALHAFIVTERYHKVEEMECIHLPVMCNL